jgi:DNA-binding transcriptional ArsR family regulator
LTYRLDGVFTVIADPHRRAILDFLSAGERSAGQIANEFEISRPAVANHLKILEANDLITIKKVGRERLHRLNVAPLLEVRDWIESYGRFWDDKLNVLKQLSEESSRRKRDIK